MRVLWLSIVPSLYDERKIGGWIGSLEKAITDNCPDIELAVVFEHKDRVFKTEKHGVVYYPVNVDYSFADKIKGKLERGYGWNKICKGFIKAIEDFKPDIIQCFGTEWPYGLISNEVDIPMIIHMQGFLNVYHPLSQLAYSMDDLKNYMWMHPIKYYRAMRKQKDKIWQEETERKIMTCNSYFMGRTDWDKGIVVHYNPNAEYYYCAEAIRPAIYDSNIRWQYNPDSMSSGNIMKIITVSQANDLKGNEIILRTANFLKNTMHFDFCWRVAGMSDYFDKYEKRCGIRHQDVNVELIGMISPEQIKNELSEAEVFVHPSIIDNSPNSLCEAQLMGIPVIASNVGGVPQLVEDDKTGMLYPYNEFQTLAFKLMDVHGDGEKLIRISEEEKKVSGERHDPKQISKTVSEIYKDILVKYEKNCNSYRKSSD